LKIPRIPPYLNTYISIVIAYSHTLHILVSVHSNYGCDPNIEIYALHNTGWYVIKLTEEFWTPLCPFKNMFPCQFDKMENLNSTVKVAHSGQKSTNIWKCVYWHDVTRTF
jgi:hypothetical protein